MDSVPVLVSVKPLCCYGIFCLPVVAAGFGLFPCFGVESLESPELHPQSRAGCRESPAMCCMARPEFGPGQAQVGAGQVRVYLGQANVGQTGSVGWLVWFD